MTRRERELKEANVSMKAKMAAMQQQMAKDRMDLQAYVMQDATALANTPPIPTADDLYSNLQEQQTGPSTHSGNSNQGTPNQAEQAQATCKEAAVMSMPEELPAAPKSDEMEPESQVVASPSGSTRMQCRSGIGLRLIMCPSGDVAVLDVREGSSAAQAGIAKGDKILSVDGATISGRGMDCVQVSSMIAGLEGSMVQLQLISAQGLEYQACAVRQQNFPVSPSPYQPCVDTWGKDLYHEKCRDALEVMVRDFYAQHAPERVGTAKQVAATYVDNLEALNQALRAQYGNDLSSLEEAGVGGGNDTVWMQERERDMKKHLSDAFDEQQRLRDLLHQREKDMKQHLFEALAEQRRLRDLLALADRAGDQEKGGDISRLEADLMLVESQALEREMELERNAWMQERERDMKQHLSEALDEQQRLRDLMRERERDMKQHLSSALDEQQRLRDLLALERARRGGEGGGENEPSLLLLEAKQSEINRLQGEVRMLERQALENEAVLEQNAAWVRDTELKLSQALGEQERLRDVLETQGASERHLRELLETQEASQQRSMVPPLPRDHPSLQHVETLHLVTGNLASTEGGGPLSQGGDAVRSDNAKAVMPGDEEQQQTPQPRRPSTPPLPILSEYSESCPSSEGLHPRQDPGQVPPFPDTRVSTVPTPLTRTPISGGEASSYFALMEELSILKGAHEEILSELRRYQDAERAEEEERESGKITDFRHADLKHQLRESQSAQKALKDFVEELEERLDAASAELTSCKSELIETKRELDESRSDALPLPLTSAAMHESDSLGGDALGLPGGSQFGTLSRIENELETCAQQVDTLHHLVGSSNSARMLKLEKLQDLLRKHRQQTLDARFPGVGARSGNQEDLVATLRRQVAALELSLDHKNAECDSLKRLVSLQEDQRNVVTHVERDVADARGREYMLEHFQRVEIDVEEMQEQVSAMQQTVTNSSKRTSELLDHFARSVTRQVQEQPQSMPAGSDISRQVLSLVAERGAVCEGLRELVSQLDSLTKFALVVGRRIANSLQEKQPHEQDQQQTPASPDESNRRVSQLEEMVEVQKAMLSQIQARLQEKSREAAESSKEAAALRLSLASSKHLEEEEEEDLSEAHNTTGVCFSVRSPPGKSPLEPGTPFESSRPQALHRRTMLLASLSALLQRQSVEYLTETLARLAADQDKAARADEGLNDPQLLPTYNDPEMTYQAAASLPPPRPRPSLQARAEIEDKVGVGLSVLLPVAAPTAEGLQGSASTGRHPVVETVMEGSPAHVDGRIAPGDILISIDPSGSGLRHILTEGKSLDDISSLVFGRTGTSVDLKIRRVEKGEETIQNVRLRRGEADHVDVELRRLRQANDALTEAMSSLHSELEARSQRLTTEQRKLEACQEELAQQSESAKELLKEKDLLLREAEAGRLGIENERAKWGMERENLEKELRVTVGEVVSAEEQLKACKNELETYKKTLREAEIALEACIKDREEEKERERAREASAKEGGLKPAEQGSQDEAVRAARCLDAVDSVAKMLAMDVIPARKAVRPAELLPTKTTMGLALDPESLKVTRVLIGGPAYLSGKIAEGDVLISIDGLRLGNQREDVTKLITGSDEPGSKCVVEVKGAKTSRTESITLQRMANDIFAHKRQMFDVLSRLQARVQKDKDASKSVGLALDLWSETLQDEHEHNAQCAAAVAHLKKECSNHLHELRVLLKEGGQSEMPRQEPGKECNKEQERVRIRELESEVERYKEAMRDAELAVKEASAFQASEAARFSLLLDGHRQELAHDRETIESLREENSRQAFEIAGLMEKLDAETTRAATAVLSVESSLRAAMLHSQARATDSGSGSEQGDAGAGARAWSASGLEMQPEDAAAGPKPAAGKTSVAEESSKTPGDEVPEHRTSKTVVAPRTAQTSAGPRAASSEATPAAGKNSKDLETAREKARRFLKRYEATRGGGAGRSSSAASDAADLSRVARDSGSSGLRAHRNSIDPK